MIQKEQGKWKIRLTKVKTGSKKQIPTSEDGHDIYLVVLTEYGLNHEDEIETHVYSTRALALKNANVLFEIKSNFGFYDGHFDKEEVAHLKHSDNKSTTVGDTGLIYREEDTYGDGMKLELVKTKLNTSIANVNRIPRCIRKTNNRMTKQRPMASEHIYLVIFTEYKPNCEDKTETHVYSTRAFALQNAHVLFEIKSKYTFYDGHFEREVSHSKRTENDSPSVGGDTVLLYHEDSPDDCGMKLEVVKTKVNASIINVDKMHYPSDADNSCFMGLS
jgi:hypothetical protein|eukprot:CAMPEP_0198280296 /NCGR_PEP_ID=MMETSP1449-20131203/383_1 /TAXON_ID=420275 /ORGANISM="Attheya septentrionalis, Strain CCMP2084" /LENGTH=274 /DNA_ID=CAMNT_0043975607 /DNA_START=567 /DNA_END=1391 /DNA_ORIENTATION=+